METLATILFVQSFMWSMILLKKSDSAFKWLLGAFSVLFVVFFLHYLSLIGVFTIPSLALMLTGILSLSLLAEYVLQLLHFVRPAKGISPLFLVASVVLLYFLNGYSFQLYVSLIPLALLIAYEVILSLRSIREEHYGSSPLEDKRFKLILSTILIKGVFWAANLLIVVGFQILQVETSLLLIVYYGLIAIGIFILGFLANSVDLKIHVPEKEYNLPVDKEWSERITTFMETEKPWLDCELTLSDLANQLGVSESELTVILNQKMQTSFYKLVNGYRINLVKVKLAEPSNKRYTILAAAYDSGFNSKSTFYRIFKEETGLTPKQFMDQVTE
jgi:AraC-like DNA-binding protein